LWPTLSASSSCRARVAPHEHATRWTYGGASATPHLRVHPGGRSSCVAFRRHREWCVGVPAPAHTLSSAHHTAISARPPSTDTWAAAAKAGALPARLPPWCRLGLARGPDGARGGRSAQRRPRHARGAQPAAHRPARGPAVHHGAQRRREPGARGHRRRRGPLCLLYTSDAADDLLCVDLGGRRSIKKKRRPDSRPCCLLYTSDAADALTRIDLG